MIEIKGAHRVLKALGAGYFIALSIKDNNLPTSREAVEEMFSNQELDINGARLKCLESNIQELLGDDVVVLFVEPLKLEEA